MKNILIILLIGLMPSLSSAKIPQAETFSAAPSGVFVPQGFDSNDNVEIFFEGIFRNACYKVGLATHTIDEEAKEIYISDNAHFFNSDFCASVLVPYKKGINTGMLAEGDYRVFFRHSRGNFVEEGLLPVRQASVERPDDHLYAPVDRTRFIAANEKNPNYQLELSGKFTNTCMKMDYIKVNYHEAGNVIDVLPIAIMNRGGCEEAPEGIEFNHKITLKKLRPGRVMFHTRALNGQSVNEIVTVR